MAASIIIGGFSRLPKEISASGTWTCELIAEIDIETSKILRANCSIPSPLISDLVEPILKDLELDKPAEVERVTEELQSRLVHRAKKAVIAALADAVREYHFYKTGGEKRETASDLASDDLDRRAARIAQRMPPTNEQHPPRH
jgi:hypothetical protein